MSKKGRFLIKIGVFVALLTLFTPIFETIVTAKNDVSDTIKARLLSDTPLSTLALTPPSIEKPDWYFSTTFTYTVSKNGSTADINEFATLANATLNDARGWSRLGVKFTQVDSGGMFNLILSQASLLPTYSSGCSSSWSCRAGNNVVINNDRWVGASDSWNNGGGSLRDYRHMVVNHEVGHWLGHDHQSCGGAGQPAPLMQQQSINLQGCTFNAWPLAGELWSSRI
jgi:hypothetical protein